MKIKINITRTNQNREINIKPGSKIIELLDKINMKPDTLIVLKNNKPIPINEQLKENDELKIIQVSSGG